MGDARARQTFARGQQRRRHGEWVFKGEGGKGEQRFHLAQRGDPEMGIAAILTTPGFERQRHLGGPQQQQGDHAEELVSRRVQQFHQPLQFARRPRRARQPGMRGHQHRRREALAFDGGGQFTKQSQVLGRLVQAFGNGLHLGMKNEAQQ